MLKDTRDGTRQPPLATSVAFLRQPDSYPDDTPEVEAIETHMAWVFLTRTRAYKLKKPVRYSFLDFSTVEARKHDCEEEVRLNRPLAPDVYLGTMPLTLQNGHLSIGGSGAIVDWLVVMRRLDRERMLDRALAREDWTAGEIESVVEWLAAFYANAPRPPITTGVYRSRLAADLLESRTEIRAMHVLGDADIRVSRITAQLLTFLHRASASFGARVSAGRIVEGHGDLRPEHIFLGPPPAVIDCIEFNASFRVLDIADDLAFLRLECERAEAPEVGALVLKHYTHASGDHPDPAIVSFHTAQRGLLRAKITLWHLRDDDVRHRGDWVGRARRYIELAESHAGRVTAAG